MTSLTRRALASCAKEEQEEEEEEEEDDDEEEGELVQGEEGEGPTLLHPHVRTRHWQGQH